MEESPKKAPSNSWLISFRRRRRAVNDRRPSNVKPSILFSRFRLSSLSLREKRERNETLSIRWTIFSSVGRVRRRVRDYRFKSLTTYRNLRAESRLKSSLGRELIRLRPNFKSTSAVRLYRHPLSRCCSRLLLKFLYMTRKMGIKWMFAERNLGQSEPTPLR